MNAILSRSFLYMLLEASSRSHKRAANASGTLWAPRQARFTSETACFEVMESASLTRSHCTASGKDATVRPGMCPAVSGRMLLNRVAAAPVRNQPSSYSALPSQTLLSLTARTNWRMNEKSSAGLVPSKRTRSMEARSLFRACVIRRRIWLMKVRFCSSRDVLILKTRKNARMLR